MYIKSLIREVSLLNIWVAKFHPSFPAQRLGLREERNIYKDMSDNQLWREQKTYHKKVTGAALVTVKKHSKDHELKLFGSCFWYVFLARSSQSVAVTSVEPFWDCRLTQSAMRSPFVQRVWIALELKGLGYQYVEVDPYKKPDALLEVNPRGLVPALRHDNWGSYESTVLLEYVSFCP